MNPENATEQIVLYAILKTLCSLYVLLFDEILVYSTELIFQQCNGLWRKMGLDRNVSTMYLYLHIHTTKTNSQDFGVNEYYVPNSDPLF